MHRKKPNYKLRRNVAKVILVLIIVIPIIIINRVKIAHLPLYLSNKEYVNVIDSMFSVDYTSDEVKNTINYLKENKKINDNTDDYILKLNAKGYSKDTIDYVIRNLNKKQITDFLDKKYSKDFEKYIKLELFKYSHYKRYENYKLKHKKLSLEDVVIRVELNMDKTYYEDSEFIKNPDDITALANKYNEVPEDYEPSDLVEMDDSYANNMYGTLTLRKEAYDMFVKMCDASREDGVTFKAESAYRSYNYQSIIYNNYVNNNGKENAEKYAARAGFSEHELGLSLDLSNIWTITSKGEEYKWLSKNAYKYGYIIRYKEEWEDITGYSAESWHIRYVGKKAAKVIQKENITFEEYYAKYILTKKSSN